MVFKYQISSKSVQCSTQTDGRIGHRQTDRHDGTKTRFSQFCK